MLGERRMKRIGKVLISVVLVLIMVMGMSMTVFAHSGRTDSSGGHHDNKNKSGLGGYHYHCGGYPAHLHDGGYCPYTDVMPSKVSMSAEKTTMRIGTESTITATVSPSNAVSTYVEWETSDSSVVTVNNGTIKAVGYGTATITATTINGKVGSVKITVKEIVAESVTIPEELDEVRINTEHQLTADILPTDVENPTITWSSSDETVATVSSVGKVKANSYGTATITATATNGKSDSVTVTVKEVAAESVAIQEVKEAIYVGKEYQLVAVITPEDVDDATITWNSNDTSVATVDENGNLKAIKTGTVDITATASNGISDTKTLTVEEVVAERIEIQAETTVIHGDTLQVTAKIYPEDTTVQDITWEVSDPEIATIDENGKIEAVNVGKVMVTAVQKDVSESFEIEVLPRQVEMVEIILPVEGGIDEGETIQLTAVVTPENATYPQVYWESSDEEIASVDENGVVEAKSWGTVVITARTEDGCEDSCEVMVNAPMGVVLGTLGGTGVVVVGGSVMIVRGVKKKVRKLKEKKSMSV